MANRTTLETELELVNMNVALGQVVHHLNPISCNLTKSYKVTYMHNTVINMSSLLAFWLNLADWSIVKDKDGHNKPDLCNFLEHVINCLLAR